MSIPLGRQVACTWQWHLSLFETTAKTSIGGPLALTATGLELQRCDVLQH